MSRRSASHHPNSPTIPIIDRARIRRKLLRWYDRHKRDLPWRRTRDPYVQWVAEIMLQQTRVRTVAPYFDRFISRFPNVESLARARHNMVLKHWEGLGYYRRALHLHEAAKQVVADGGEMPRSARGLRRLPGIGDYTAAAIASIAFDEPVAAVDGNVTRVIARLLAVSDNVKSTGGKTRIRELADWLITPRKPGDFNQAVMDLGSDVCTPTSPRCSACPLCDECIANRSGDPSTYPVASAKREPVVKELVAGVFVWRGRVLMRRRPIGGLWSGLWEMPTLEVNSGRRKTFDQLAANVGLQVDEVKQVGEVKHQLTHRSLVFHVYVASIDEGSDVESAARWCTAAQLDRLPISKAHRKVLDVASDAVARIRQQSRVRRRASG